MSDMIYCFNKSYTNNYHLNIQLSICAFHQLTVVSLHFMIISVRDEENVNSGST